MNQYASSVAASDYTRSDLAHSPLVQSTGVLKHFKLIHYPPGFVLQMPVEENPAEVPCFEDHPHLFPVYLFWLFLEQEWADGGDETAQHQGRPTGR